MPPSERLCSSSLARNQMSSAAAPCLRTDTSEQQHALELKVSELYQDLAEFDAPDREEMLMLLRDKHTRYLQGGLGQLPGAFVSLDASRPWICYWVLHGLALLQAPLPQDISAHEVVSFLNSCQHPEGGYGGGPGQLAHLAPTYAAVSALLTLGGEEALGSINRQAAWQFLNRMAIPPEQGGGFRMHDGGEADVRSCYTAMAVAAGLCLDAQALAAKAGMVDYIRRCQTYEGGIGGEPGNEAHGGYTYCGLAALALAGCPQALDLPRLLHWAAQRQGWVEGGFNGRTNKLVDGCYSFWQGGVFPILQQLLEVPPQQGDLVPQQQVPAGMDACCAGTAYPPTAVPQRWAQQQQQQQQQQRLVVPEPPDLSRVLGPREQAEAEAERLNTAFEALAEAALADGGAGDDADANKTAVTSEPQSEAAAAVGSEAGEAASCGAAEGKVELLRRADAAEQAANYADQAAEIADLSAAVLFPCTTTSSSSSSNSTAATGDGNPLFNTRALQLWVLRGCQQLKGGLRDKPGKSADYYHTCYCLSGLSAAQHIMGGCVVGPPAEQGGAGGGGEGACSSSANSLAAADPLLNVVVHKVAEAKRFFAGAAVVC